MNSKRITALANDISKDDIVLDVGCDHGYLCVYLKLNNLCKEVYASDISDSALNGAKENFKKYGLEIKTFVSDGFKKIPVFFNTAVIAGMGTNTILNILKDEKTPKKLVIASNNDYYLLRSSLNKLGYKIVDEQVIFEKKHYYCVMLCIKGKQKLKKSELLFGISNDENYYKYLFNKNIELISKVPFKKKLRLYYECFLLKGLIGKK